MNWLLLIRIVLAIVSAFSGTVAAGNGIETTKAYADSGEADWWNLAATIVPAVISFVSGLGVIQLPSWLPKGLLHWMGEVDRKEALELFYAVLSYFRDPNEKTLRRARNEAMDIVLQTCAEGDTEALECFAKGMALLHAKDMAMLVASYPKYSAAARRDV